jgi:hypothetical protein
MFYGFCGHGATRFPTLACSILHVGTAGTAFSPFFGRKRRLMDPGRRTERHAKIESSQHIANIPLLRGHIPREHASSRARPASLLHV